MLPHIPNPHSRVLEIGCSTGHLLSVLRESGISNVRGVDPSPGCARAAREHYGIEVDTYSIFDIPEQTYDFLILVGVMEHIRDLEQATAKIGRLLVPAGRVYLAVPDAAAFAAQTDGPYQEFSVEHLTFFSLSSLTNLMQMRGFRRIAGGHFVCAPSHGTTGGIVWGVFEAGPYEPRLEKDTETETGLAAYICKSEQVDARVRRIIAGIAASADPILVWGTGAHTLRLLAEGGLDKVNIHAFIDSNPKYQGRNLHGRPVMAPADLQERKEPILISSFAAQHDIAIQIRDRLRLANEIITLYQI
jgi:SAM-dependent methyltransferase